MYICAQSKQDWYANLGLALKAILAEYRLRYTQLTLLLANLSANLVACICRVVELYARVFDNTFV